MVLSHLTGLRRIIGVLAGTVAPAQLPSTLLGIAEVAGGACVLASVEKRYVLYREITPVVAEDDGS